MLEANQKELEAAELQAILGQGVTLPPQPKVLMEIDELSNKPRVNVKAIADAISRDPALLASVFKVVNSPAMGLSRRIDSAEAAISLLGLKQVTNIVTSIAIRQTLNGNSLAYERFWERANDIAQFAAVIAKKQYSICGIPPDQAYMAGLFHDCGVPVLMQRFPGYGASLEQATGSWPDLGEEDRKHNTSHCVVGYLVGKHWRLPELVLNGIHHHHEQPAHNHPAKTVVALLQMATHIYNVMMKQPDEAEWENWAMLVIEDMGVSIDGLREFEEDVIERFTAGAR